MKKILLLIFILLAMVGTIVLCYFNSYKNEMEINMKTNPTTGYDWTYSYSNENILKNIKTEYTSDPNMKGASGVGGTNSYVFKALKSGTTTLTFIYSRSWEHNKEPVYKIIYTIEVDKKLNIKIIDTDGNYINDIPTPIIK